MIRQTVLPFKLERTDESLTAHGGLALVAEYAQALGLRALVHRYHIAFLLTQVGGRPWTFHPRNLHLLETISMSLTGLLSPSLLPHTTPP